MATKSNSDNRERMLSSKTCVCVMALWFFDTRVEQFLHTSIKPSQKWKSGSGPAPPRELSRVLTAASWVAPVGKIMEGGSPGKSQGVHQSGAWVSAPSGSGAGGSAGQALDDSMGVQGVRGRARWK